MASSTSDAWVRFINAFNENKPDDIADLVADEFVDHHVPEELPRGMEGVRMWWGILHSAFRARIDVDDVIEGSDRLAARWRYSGTHVGEFNGIPATDRSFSAEFMSVERFEQGKWVERWEVGDTLGLLQQIGGIPS